MDDDRTPYPRVVWERCTDDKGRLRRKLRSRSVEVRCARGHLLAYLLPTPGGNLWVRRNPWVERDDQHGWVVGWAAEDHIQTAHCTCQRSYLLDPTKLDLSRRTMRPEEVAPDHGPAKPRTDVPNPFALRPPAMLASPVDSLSRVTRPDPHTEPSA